MKELVFIAHRLPFPPNKGEKLRAYHFLKFMAQRYPTHLLCHIDEERDLEAVQKIDLPLASLHYHFSPRNQRKRRCLKALLTGRSLSVAYFYDVPLQKAFNTLLRKRPIDFIFCSCSPAAEYVFQARISGRTLLLDFMDVDSEKWRAFSRHTIPPMCWIYALESRRLRPYEKKIAQTFDQVFLVTEAEARLFREKVCDTGNIFVIENGVDLERFSPDYQSPLNKKSPTLVFTGAMDYWPNAEGVIWFSKEIFPKIKQVFPETRFYIVGKDPTKEVRELSKIEGVEVTGFVADIRDYMALADVCVAPLRLARGVQNKILEAMAMGKPVVATSAAAEGIKAQPGKHLLVADSPDEFAQAILTLLKDPSKALQIGWQARILVENHYLWEKQLRKLERLLP